MIKGLPNSYKYELTRHLTCARVVNHHAASGTDPCEAYSDARCRVEPIVLKGQYSAGQLVKVTHGLRASNSTSNNSCPTGWKLWSPRSKEDWQTAIASTTLPAAPFLLVDVTRSSDGCGGCTDHAMKSGVAQQSSWVTSDGSPWWLRDTKYTEPNGDYKANCYLEIKSTNPDDLEFNDSACEAYSTSYLCQPRGNIGELLLAFFCGHACGCQGCVRV